jgi:hypothetical protein
MSDPRDRMHVVENTLALEALHDYAICRALAPSFEVHVERVDGAVYVAWSIELGGERYGASIALRFATTDKQIEELMFVLIHARLTIVRVTSRFISGHER